MTRAALVVLTAAALALNRVRRIVGGFDSARRDSDGHCRGVGITGPASGRRI